MFLICAGVIFFVASLTAHVKRRLSGWVGMLWMVVSIVLFILGFFPAWDDWGRLVSHQATAAFFVLASSFLTGLFMVCLSLSRLTDQVRELTIQVSMLNQENEHALSEIRQLGLHKMEKEDPQSAEVEAVQADTEKQIAEMGTKKQRGSRKSR